MLLNIVENLISEYEKVKSSITPKEFAKANITYRRKKYDNSTQFYKDYFNTHPDKLVNAIKEYKRIKKHKKDEYYLADL